jgi:asparagine synthase (glutamine-hydrolysing)
MCGFGGVFNSKSSLNISFVEKIAFKVNFRGPDYTNVIVFDQNFSHSNVGNSALFFNRLAVIDLNARSNQPFYKDGFYLLFNGEIYNHNFLKNLLSDVVFTTTSDTEILFHLLIKFGSEAINLLNGMFSIVFLNLNTQEVILARDRFGIKPLYYQIDEKNKSIAFGSDLDSVIRLGNFDNFSFNLNALKDFWEFNYTVTPYTLLPNVNKLEPGKILKYNLNSGNYSKIKYYEIYSNESYDYTVDDIEVALIKSIELQLVADVEVGIFLSSGVDSSLLLSLISEKFPTRKIKVFTVQFDDNYVENENNDAVNFLKKLNNKNIEHIQLKIVVKDIIKTLKEIYRYFDEPISDPAIILNYLISKEARKHVTVVLSGDGADELFWGYDRYNFMSSSLLRFGQFIYKNLFFDYFLPNFVKRKLWPLRISKFPILQYLRSISNKRYNFSHPINSTHYYWFYEELINVEQSLKLKSFIDLKLYLVDGMLAKVDKTSMANSIEIRVPYLDNDLTKLAIHSKLSLLKDNTYSTKSPLKKILKKYHPDFKIHKYKKGFSFPKKLWLKSEMKDFVYNVFNIANYTQFGLDEIKTKRLVDDYFSGNSTLENEIWMLMNLFLWYNEFKTKHNISE